jgi:hypothetical protein
MKLDGFTFTSDRGPIYSLEKLNFHGKSMDN